MKYKRGKRVKGMSIGRQTIFIRRKFGRCRNTSQGFDILDPSLRIKKIT
jgi:hypothetical protein